MLNLRYYVNIGSLLLGCDLQDTHTYIDMSTRRKKKSFQEICQTHIYTGFLAAKNGKGKGKEKNYKHYSVKMDIATSI